MARPTARTQAVSLGISLVSGVTIGYLLRGYLFAACLLAVVNGLVIGLAVPTVMATRERGIHDDDDEL